MLAKSIFSCLQLLLTAGGDNLYFPLAVEGNKVSVVTAQPVSSFAPAHLLCGLGDLNQGWWRSGS